MSGSWGVRNIDCTTRGLAALVAWTAICCAVSSSPAARALPPPAVPLSAAGPPRPPVAAE
ncbi:hypothetical protein O1L68_38365 [Streptomyces lydicus]|nr:hypothetical protein [Streptomyces lydicus]